tara:strand:+ start:175 stop:339 length:165 start_codon:yes stop_codon:yes gene_type:complete
MIFIANHIIIILVDLMLSVDLITFIMVETSMGATITSGIMIVMVQEQLITLEAI